jgi:hypothetical protein
MARPRGGYFASNFAGAAYMHGLGPGEGRSFLMAANVGIFYQAHHPAIVPDMFLSLDVQVATDW